MEITADRWQKRLRKKNRLHQDFLHVVLNSLCNKGLGDVFQV